MLARSNWPKDYAEQFWENYPRRIAKKAAIKVLEKIRLTNEVPFEVLLSAVKLYARSVAGKQMRYVKHPATWLNGGCWDDDPAALLDCRIRPTASPRPIWRPPPAPQRATDNELDEQFKRLGLQHLRRK